MTLVFPSVIKGPSKTTACFDPYLPSLPSASKVSGPEFKSKFSLDLILSLLGVGIFVNPIKDVGYGAEELHQRSKSKKYLE